MYVGGFWGDWRRKFLRRKFWDEDGILSFMLQRLSLKQENEMGMERILDGGKISGKIPSTPIFRFVDIPTTSFKRGCQSCLNLKKNTTQTFIF
jgi:hypothetical protein